MTSTPTTTKPGATIVDLNGVRDKQTAAWKAKVTAIVGQHVDAAFSEGARAVAAEFPHVGLDDYARAFCRALQSENDSHPFA